MGSDFPELGTSLQVNSDHFTVLFATGALSSCVPPSPGKRTPAQEDKGMDSTTSQGKGVPSKSCELLDAPSAHSGLDMPEKPPQDPSAQEKHWKVERAENLKGRLGHCLSQALSSSFFIDQGKGVITDNQVPALNARETH